MNYQLANNSRKEIEVLNIKEQYNTKFKYNSSNDVGSQNDLNSPHSSNHSEHTPKSFYDKFDDEVIIKEKIEQLEEMNQISQIFHELSIIVAFRC